MNTFITTADSIINLFCTEYNACLIESILLSSNVVDDDDDDNLTQEELTLSLIPLLFEIDMNYTEQPTDVPQPHMYNYAKYAPTL